MNQQPKTFRVIPERGVWGAGRPQKIRRLEAHSDAGSLQMRSIRLETRSSWTEGSTPEGWCPEERGQDLGHRTEDRTQSKQRGRPERGESPPRGLGGRVGVGSALPHLDLTRAWRTHSWCSWVPRSKHLQQIKQEQEGWGGRATRVWGPPQGGIVEAEPESPNGPLRDTQGGMWRPGNSRCRGPRRWRGQAWAEPGWPSTGGPGGPEDLLSTYSK